MISGIGTRDFCLQGFESYVIATSNSNASGMQTPVAQSWNQWISTQPGRGLSANMDFSRPKTIRANQLIALNSIWCWTCTMALHPSLIQISNRLHKSMIWPSIYSEVYWNILKSHQTRKPIKSLHSFRNANEARENLLGQRRIYHSCKWWFSVPCLWRILLVVREIVPQQKKTKGHVKS